MLPSGLKTRDLDLDLSGYCRETFLPAPPLHKWPLHCYHWARGRSSSSVSSEISADGTGSGEGDLQEGTISTSLEPLFGAGGWRAAEVSQTTWGSVSH